MTNKIYTIIDSLNESSVIYFCCNCSSCAIGHISKHLIRCCLIKGRSKVELRCILCGKIIVEGIWCLAISTLYGSETSHLLSENLIVGKTKFIGEQASLDLVFN